MRAYNSYNHIHISFILYIHTCTYIYIYEGRVDVLLVGPARMYTYMYTLHVLQHMLYNIYIYIYICREREREREGEREREKGREREREREQIHYIVHCMLYAICHMPYATSCCGSGA